MVSEFKLPMCGYVSFTFFDSVMCIRCYSTGTHMQVGQQYVDLVIKSLHSGIGWYLWNWKIERSVGFNEWDVQFQYKQRNGLRAT
jgi:hypothetical protein